MTSDSTRPDPLTRMARSRDNENTIRILLDYTPLPAPTLVGRPDAVYVTVADVDDLGEWLAALGGFIHVSPPFEGVRTWVLHTHTAPAADGAVVQIRVSVPVLADDQVMAEIRAAVAA